MCEKIGLKGMSGRSSAQFVSSPGQACKCPQLESILTLKFLQVHNIAYRQQMLWLPDVQLLLDPSF